MKLKKEVDSQNEIISVLQADIEELTVKLYKRELKLPSLGSEIQYVGACAT